MTDNFRQRLGTIIMLIGAILVIGAMALFAYNEILDYSAGKSSGSVVVELRKHYLTTDPEQTENKDIQIELDREVTPTPVPEMAVVTIDDHDYIGTIIIPELNIELPVMDKWNDNVADLKIAPIRYSGSVFTDDMVIAGHNYRSHFNPLHNASVGMEVVFEDVYGNQYIYEIVEFETIQPTAISDMVISDADLTLFTCTYGGSARYTVRCDRIN